MSDPRFAPDEQLDHAQTVVFEALYRAGCVVACDPYDGDDCGSVAVMAVHALRAAGYALVPPCAKPEKTSSPTE